MTRPCQHERARFFCVQQLGQLAPVELRHCPACKSTIAADTPRQAVRPVARTANARRPVAAA